MQVLMTTNENKKYGIFADMKHLIPLSGMILQGMKNNSLKAKGGADDFKSV